MPDCSVYYGSKISSHFFLQNGCRFAAPVSDSKELKLRSSAIPVKTNACTEWGVKLCADWSRARAVEVDRVSPTTPLLQMPVPDFAYWLEKFVLEISKQTGTKYPPKTLYAIVCCFKRYFERNEVYDVNPLSPLDPRFGNCATTLYRQDFSDQLIKERTGHHSLKLYMNINELDPTSNTRYRWHYSHK